MIREHGGGGERRGWGALKLDGFSIRSWALQRASSLSFIFITPFHYSL